MSGLTRGGMVDPSGETKFSNAEGDREENSLSDHEQDCQPYLVDLHC